jgi:hypothetical protein
VKVEDAALMPIAGYCSPEIMMGEIVPNIKVIVTVIWRILLGCKEITEDRHEFTIYNLRWNNSLVTLEVVLAWTITLRVMPAATMTYVLVFYMAIESIFIPDVNRF